MKKQLIAKLLVLAMVFTMIPVSILAASAADEVESEPDTSAGDTITPDDTDTPSDSEEDPTRPGASTDEQAKAELPEYSYSVAADTTPSAEDIVVEGGTVVINVEVVGGVAFVRFTEEVMVALADNVTEEGVLELTLTTTEEVTSVTQSFAGEALNAMGANLVMNWGESRITIPGDQLAKATQNDKGEDPAVIAITLTAAEDHPIVTVYADWVVVPVRGIQYK